MQRTVLAVLAALSIVGQASALAPFQLSEPLGMEWASNNTNFTTTWSKPFNITKQFLSGFSSGSMLSTNILRLDPEGFDGFGLLSGTLMDNFTKMIPTNYSELPVQNLKEKQVFTYVGAADLVPEDYFKDTQEYFKRGGAEVTAQFIHDFSHVMPSNLPENKQYHPYNSCNIPTDTNPADYFQPPKKSVFRNCGYNLAYYMLQAWSPAQPLNERALNHTQLGDFHAFNQSAFTAELDGAKMSDVGYIYIPHACKAGNYCQTVMFLHGCMQSGEWWKDTEARRTGLLEYAATNNQIVIFPQNKDMVKLDMGKGKMWDFYFCWSSMESDDKNHPQIQSLRKMLNSLVLGSDAQVDLTNFSESEISEAALSQKSANNQLMRIEKSLDLADMLILQI